MQIHSIFLSLDGEVNFMGQGIPSAFVRLQGCNLGDETCPWCDTKDSRNPAGGQVMTIEQVFQAIMDIGCPKVTITGGEPLLQEDEIHQLLNRLFPYNIRISIETNGTQSLGRFRNLTKPNPDVCLVVDWKFDERRIWREEYENLTPWDWIKFIIDNRGNYELARQEVKSLIARGKTQARIAFSAVHGLLPGETLAHWILDDQLWQVSLNVQIHKFLNLK
jgi:7-carboxy-7-deazaguanine synthase